MVDSVITSSSSGKDGKFWEVLSDFTKINYAYPLQAVTINLDYWNSLDKAQQEAMLKAANEIEKEQWTAIKLEDKDALDTMAQNGMKISEASEELKKELDGIANKMLEEYLADADEQTKNIFKEYRK
jgi:TRAP-type C4-dicarboxylate transport system substrate-binding protein